MAGNLFCSFSEKPGFPGGHDPQGQPWVYMDLPCEKHRESLVTVGQVDCDLHAPGPAGLCSCAK